MCRHHPVTKYLAKPAPPQLDSGAVSMHVNLDLLGWDLPHRPVPPLIPQLLQDDALLAMQRARRARDVHHPRRALRRPRAPVGQHH